MTALILLGIIASVIMFLGSLISDRHSLPEDEEAMMKRFNARYGWRCLK